MLAAGGHVIGVIPCTGLVARAAHLRVPNFRAAAVVLMHERKAMMAELSTRSSPLAVGTFEELCEVITVETSLEADRKRCGLVNVLGVFNGIDCLTSSIAP